MCPVLIPLLDPCYVFHRPSPVRTKTFSAHHVAKFRHVVRKSGVFTHGKNSHEGVGCVEIATLSFGALGGDGASGGSLRSSRQAGA